MNKGKENYNNIPLPDGLSDAIRTGLDRGKKYNTKKWITGFGSLAAACLCLVVIMRIFPFTNGTGGDNSNIPSPANSSDTPVTPQAFSDERPVEVQEPENYRIPCKQTSETSPKMPVYHVEEKWAPHRLIFTLYDIRDFDFDAVSKPLLESSMVQDVYRSILLDDSAVSFVVELPINIEYQLSEHTGDGYVELSLRPSDTADEIREIYFLSSPEMDGGEETALFRESLPIGEYSIVKTREGKFLVVTGEFETQQEAEEMLAQLEQNGMEPGTLQVASCMSDESPAGSASQDTVTLPETTTPSSIRVYGTVTEINGSQVTISNDNQDDPYSTIILNINEDTLILTAEDCKEKTLKDLQKGDTLYAYVSPVMTRSLPPMSNAELILCQIPADMMVPTYAAITDVSSDPDGALRITTDQELVCYINEDTVIKTLDGKKDLDSSVLQSGNKILIWYQIATLSIPAQTNPDEIRVLP